MAEKEINLRRLVIKAFHMTDVEWGDENNITTDGHMTVSKGMLEQLTAEDDCIEKIDIQIIKPGDHDRWTNTIMDNPDFYKGSWKVGRRYYTYGNRCICNVDRCRCGWQAMS